MSKYSEWLEKNLGKTIDYDKQYGIQCYDWFNKYASDLLGVPNSLLFSHMYACEVYTDFNMQDYFTRIPNTPSFVPKVGDVCIWSASLNGGAGHIAIATGQGNTKEFYVTEQNTNGLAKDPSKTVKRNYNFFLGVLRPKKQDIFKDTEKLTVALSIGSILIPDYYKLKTEVNVRTSPSLSAKIVKTCKKGEMYYISEFTYVSDMTWGKLSTGMWICVNYKSEFYVNVTGTVKADGVNYRANPAGKVLGVTNKNKKLTFTRETNGWGYSPELKGWISLAYVRG